MIALVCSVAMAQDGQSSQTQPDKIMPAADHHQHVFSPAYTAKFLPAGSKSITAQDVIALLDKAGIRRAVFLANGYSFGRPGSEPPNEYEAVKADNDWAGAQAALFPKRLVAFCGFNPLKEYALAELARCAKDPNLRKGIKLHFGSSDVQTEIPEHFEKVKKVFQAANSHRMAIVVHMRASISKKRPYGPEQARAFLELLSYAPDIPVQVAHLASSGPSYMDPSAHSVIEVLANAIEKKDPRTRKLWFDVASNAHPRNSPETSELMAKFIRRIGVKRILYGTDAATGDNLRPRESWAAFRQLKLSDKEFKTIAGNVAPYFR
ncbi:MAG TPA: amidohydrolase family protein [Pyrinomonadaceae bacterium]|nr:amidohydrolase family protein [Pyrinomonadaceae bacterium]